MYISGPHFWKVNVNYKKNILGVEICTTSFNLPHLIHSLKTKTSPLNIGHWPQKENSSDSTFIDSQLFEGKNVQKRQRQHPKASVLCQRLNPQEHDIVRMYPFRLCGSPPYTIPYYKVAPPISYKEGCISTYRSYNPIYDW